MNEEWIIVEADHGISLFSDVKGIDLWQDGSVQRVTTSRDSHGYACGSGQVHLNPHSLKEALEVACALVLNRKAKTEE